MERKSILIIDGDENTRSTLKQLFENEYQILMAEDGKSGISQIIGHLNDLAAIIMDLVMPNMNGYQILQILHSKRIVERVPVIILTAQRSQQIDLACYNLGVANIISKPFTAQAVLIRVSRAIEINQRAENLEDTVQSVQKSLSEQTQKVDLYYERLIVAISNLVEFRNLESNNHVKRVMGFTEIFANAYAKLIPDSGLTQEKINMIVRASALHDIGKITISDSILLKPGKLTDNERAVMQSHTTKGCEILSFLKDVQDLELYKIAYEICRHHHERYDGGGYPDKLRGRDIPLSAQFVSIADVYDALVSDRPYKKAYDRNVAFHMIMNGECGVFAPELIQCLSKMRDEIEDFSDTL